MIDYVLVLATESKVPSNEGALLLHRTCHQPPCAELILETARDVNSCVEAGLVRGYE